MSTYQQRPGDISIFAETDKKNDKAPDWKGTMIIPEGVQPGDKLEVAFWAKGGRGTMLAGSVKPARQRDEAQAFRKPDAGGVSGSDRDDPFSDPIPF